MTLTGLPFIVVALVATALAGTGTVLFWSRSGRWRPAGRIAARTTGILLSEALLVFGAGLITNRAEQFYPSWAALGGRTGAAAATAPRAAGRLDETLRTHGAATLPWRPPGEAGWHLAGHPALVVPAGYTDRPGVTFPVLLDLAGAHRAGDTVTVHLAPTARTGVASLAALPADLARDVRVAARGWAIVAPMTDAAFAAELVRSAPGRFVALALVGTGTPPRVGIATAVVRPRRAAPEPGVTVLIGAGPGAWKLAANWAAGQTGPPLAAPVQLPEAQVKPAAPGREAHLAVPSPPSRRGRSVAS
jgi:hypothetical protein